MGRRTSYGRRNRRAVSRTRGHFFFICALAGVLLSIILIHKIRNNLIGATTECSPELTETLMLLFLYPF